MKRIAIILFFLSALLPVTAHDVDSLVMKVLSTQLLRDYNSVQSCSFTKYEKIQASLRNIGALNRNRKLMRKYKWLQNVIDITGADTMTVPVMTSQSVIRTYWRKNPEKMVQEILGINQEGLNGIFDTGDILDMAVTHDFPNFSIYDNVLIVDDKELPSPIAIDCSQHYDYETVDADGMADVACAGAEVTGGRGEVMKVRFTPKPGQDHGLSGFITLTKDSVWRVARIRFQVLRNTGKNKTDTVSVTESFVTDKDGYTLPRSIDFLLDVHRMKLLGNVQLRKTQMYYDFSVAPVPEKVFRHRAKRKYSPMAEYREPEFWARYDRNLARVLTDYRTEDSLQYYTIPTDSTGAARHRQSAIQEYASSGLDYLGSLRRGLKFITVPVKALVNDYIPLGSPSRFDIEPVISLMSFNNIDKFRLRFGGTTTANLFRRWFFSGYLAYGFGSHKVYGQAKMTYSFIDKVYSQAEFPYRNVSVEYRNDICYLGERSIHSDDDNLFRSIQWSNTAHMMFYNLQKVEMEWDMRNGIGFMAGIKRESGTGAGDLIFHTLHDVNTNAGTVGGDGNTLLRDNGSVCTTELRFALVYYPPSQRYFHRREPVPVNAELPTIGFYHFIGVKLFGGSYLYHLSQLTATKKWYLGSFGIGETTLKAGNVWNTVPFPLLIAPQTNISYFGDDSAFNLLNRCEFMNDRYIMLHLSLETNGRLLGAIPVIKRLRWKEFFGVRMLWGAIRDRNNPLLEQNRDSKILMPLPVNVWVMDGNIPYVEGMVGIHNIFHIINLDFIYRFTYRDLENASLSGFRFSLHF